MSSYDASLFIGKALWNKVCFVAVLLVLICIYSIHPSQQTNRHGNFLSNSYNEFRFGSPSQWKVKSARRLVPHLHILHPSIQPNKPTREFLINLEINSCSRMRTRSKNLFQSISLWKYRKSCILALAFTNKMTSSANHTK